MKTFLKITLLVIVALVALKFLPLTLALGCVLALVVAGLALVGVSILAALFVALLLAAMVLAPVWIPVLAIMLIIGLARRLWRRPVAA
jgi:hypothetical protein